VRPDAQAPDWYRASSDPVVGRALRLLHHNPTRGRWPSSRARATCRARRSPAASRSSSANRRCPFLTGWRIALAADLLLEPGATIGSVAHQVGYGSAFALSTAFKRIRGVSPQQHRAAAAAGARVGQAG
jgi:AraC-like DNA-binding protein